MANSEDIVTQETKDRFNTMNLNNDACFIFIFNNNNILLQIVINK